MRPLPCPRCGYDAPGPGCPHCGDAPHERSLAGRPAGLLGGVAAGLAALPRGLYYLATTPGLKRWMLPPFLLTSSLLVAVWVEVYRAWSRFLEHAVPGEVHLEPEPAPGRWHWVQATWAFLLAAAEWVANAALWLFTSHALQLVAWFLLGTLVSWYLFSIVYEALAGPFLDEMQARLEVRFFGSDPRSRLERPNDLSPERAARLATTAAGLGAAAFLLLHLGLGTSLLHALPALLAGLPVVALVDRRFGPWLLWVARVEGRATWASLQASLVTGVILVLALPLYFVPGVGYFLFAGVAGFATAVSLLDIPLERRDWPLGMRMRFLLRNVPALIAFGCVAGFLLALPVIGPLLLVPAASLGGLWLVCRLDKGPLRADGSPTA